MRLKAQRMQIKVGQKNLKRIDPHWHCLDKGELSDQIAAMIDEGYQVATKRTIRDGELLKFVWNQRCLGGLLCIQSAMIGNGERI
jgi:hypothetical protein